MLWHSDAVPKRVDHEQRRAQITEALWQVARREGLPAVTLRRVAAEAGISMNLVQYYFPAKEEMLRYSLDRLVRQASDRMRSEIAAHGGGDPRAALRACLLAMLPVDERGRLLTAVHHAYVAYGMVDPELAALSNRIPRELADQLTPMLEPALGEAGAGVDAARELDGLIAMVAGLAPGILVGTYSADEAVALVDYRLGRIFGDRDTALADLKDKQTGA